MVKPYAINEPTVSRTGPNVLISGAGFAGLATAYWLHRLGYRVTLVEIAEGLRNGGTPVDIEGDALDALCRMELMDVVRAKALPPRKLHFVDACGQTIGEMGADPGPGSEKYEIHRDDLLGILFAAIDGDVEVIFGRSITRLEDGPDAVAVTFDDGTSRDYALVFGCDGNRSTTRRLAFGDNIDVSHPLGCSFLIKVVPATGLLPANISQIFNAPGRMALLNGYDDRTDIGFAFRHTGQATDAHRDRAQQRRIVHDHFGSLGWQVPAMLAHVDTNDDFYFDQATQIRMPEWSIGRVALVGDAGYCVSPLAGMGGSIAIIGAAALGEALRKHGNDHSAAFRAYHESLYAFVRSVQDDAAGPNLAMMLPADDLAIANRDEMVSSDAVVP